MAKRPPKIPNTTHVKDTHLWDEVKKSVTPIDKSESLSGAPPRLPDQDRVNPRMAVRNPDLRTPYEAPKAQTGLSRKQVRKLSTGQMSIDLTIDLHGMSRLEAERLLERRIPEAQRQGDRCLLLITGKGGRRFAQTSDTPVEDRTRDDFSMHQGTLRSFVPEILSKAPLSHYVASHRPSVQKHGGEGAMYVMLRGKVGKS